MLAGDVEDAIRLHALQYFVGGIEFVRLRELSDVAGVQYQRGTLRQRVQFSYRFLQRRRDILVGFLAEADVTVADLSEEHALTLRFGERVERVQAERGRDSATQRPHSRGSCPGHALEEASAIYTVFGESVRYEV